jgi:PilZ domain
MEHRWGERARVDVPVRLDAGPHSLVSGIIRNVSLSGAYLETRADLSPWTPVFVELPCGLLGRGEPPDRIRAYVIRRDRTGLALEWSEFAPEIVRTLIAQLDQSKTSQSGAAAVATAPHEPSPVAPQSRDAGWVSMCTRDTVGSPGRTGVRALQSRCGHAGTQRA